jgi:hypothetical protein
MMPFMLASLPAQRGSGILMVKVDVELLPPPSLPVPISTAAPTKITSIAPTRTPRIPLPSDIVLAPEKQTLLWLAQALAERAGQQLVP